MRKVEYFIVGQGLAGTMLAFSMLENNLDFRIISSPQKSKASVVAAGMINPLVFKRMTKSWLADDLLPLMKLQYQNLEKKLNVDFYFEKEILKPLSSQEMQLWIERKSNPDFSNYIQSVLTKKRIPQLSDAAGYGIISGGGYVDLPVFLHSAEQYFRQKNLIINSPLPFSAGIPFRGSFESGNIQASKIVFCEGFHVRENPFFGFVKLSPVKGEVLLVHALQLSEEYILNRKVFVLPVGNQYFKVGSTYDWENLDELPTEKGKLSILENFENLVSTPYSVKNQWAGIRPAILDRRPVLGSHPEFDNVFIFNGLGTKGVMLAPYFASEMLKKLTISNYELNPEVRVERFYRKQD